MNAKIWIITGISSGLGQALAETVMQTGDFVIGTMRNSQQIEAFNTQYKDRAKAYHLDITEPSAIEDFQEQVVQEFGRVDVLVNNAGVGFVGAIEETSLAEVQSVFEANFYGALNLTRSFLPIMRSQKFGHIVQISSHGGLKAFAGFGIYNASKFALEGFSEALAQEVAPLGIQVSIVEPGPFRTKFASQALGEAKRVIQDYDSTAGAFRSKLKGVDGLQEGDPTKAALAIISHVKSENPTLRLPLGKVALATIGMKVQSIQADLEVNREVAAQAVFE